MTNLDLDDLPPRLAKVLAGLGEGDELLLVQGGAVVARLAIAAARSEVTAEPAADADMEEILEHFKTMIEEEF
jgi:antitoxin (DNA-binding transcriptional repressor) of toxin-antitoxin stability system